LHITAVKFQCCLALPAFFYFQGIDFCRNGLHKKQCIGLLVFNQYIFKNYPVEKSNINLSNLIFGTNLFRKMSGQPLCNIGLNLAVLQGQPGTSLQATG
jgi:hypothetical protein